jgi:hypothetical protein
VFAGIGMGYATSFLGASITRAVWEPTILDLVARNLTTKLVSRTMATACLPATQLARNLGRIGPDESLDSIDPAPCQRKEPAIGGRSG